MWCKAWASALSSWPSNVSPCRLCLYSFPQDLCPEAFYDTWMLITPTFPSLVFASLVYIIYLSSPLGDLIDTLYWIGPQWNSWSQLPTLTPHLPCVPVSAEDSPSTQLPGPRAQKPASFPSPFHDSNPAVFRCCGSRPTSGLPEWPLNCSFFFFC